MAAILNFLENWEIAQNQLQEINQEHWKCIQSAYVKH